MPKLKPTLTAHIGWKKVLFFFILSNLTFGFMFFVTVPMVKAYSGGMELLDLMAGGYSAEYVNTLFATLGESGREVYLWKQIPVDMLYPFLFGAGYCLLLAFFLDKLGRLNGPFLYLCLVPVLGGLVDYLENFGTINMLLNYPKFSDNAASLNSMFTILKSSLIGLYFIIQAVVLLVYGLSKISKR